VAVLLGDFFSLFEHFFVVELGVVAALEVEHPALYLLALGMQVYQLLQLLDHPEVLRPKCTLHWQDSVAKSGHLSTLLVNLLHYFGNHPQGVDLTEDWIDFYETDTLDNWWGTLTLVSTWVSNLALAFLL
jgi:hypothetical protein